MSYKKIALLATLIIGITNLSYSQEPTTAASNITATSISSSGATISWTNGSGAYRLTTLAQGTSNSNVPTDFVGYSASTAFGSGTAIGGSYVLYKNSASSVPVTNLSPSLPYTVAVFEYNGVALPNYKTNTYPTYTFYTQPSTKAKNLNFTNVKHNQMTLSWSNGNGTRRIVLAEKNSSVSALPAYGMTYTASAVFGNGTQLGSNTYVIYDGIGTSTTVSNLSSGTQYSFAVIEYAGSGSVTNYLTSSYLTSSQTTLNQAEPTIASSNLSFSGVSTNSLVVNWTNGNGAGKFLAVKPSRMRTALAFDGVNDSVVIPHHYTQNSLPLTVSCWVKTTQNSNAVSSIINKYVVNSYNGYQLYVYQGNIIGWYFGNTTNYIWPGNGGTPGGTNGGFIADGDWHHIAFVVNSGGADLYVDGAKRCSNDWVGTATAASNTRNIRLGSYPGISQFQGQIDEVSIWNTDLSAYEIQTYMNSSLLGNELNMTGYWPIDDGYTTASSIKSKAISNPTLNGTLYNMPTTAASNFTSSSGWVYSGSGVDAPLDGYNYIQKSTFAQGSEIGNGYYAMYGSMLGATSATVTGLSPGTTYHFALYDFNGVIATGNANYLTSAYATAEQQTSVGSAPVISSFSPTSGAPGTVITITGTGFSTTFTDNKVFIGGLKATVVSATATQLKVTLPFGVAHAPIQVTVNNLTGYSSKAFIVNKSCSSSGIAAGSFVLTNTTAVASYGYDNVFADIDGDGRPDLLSAGWSANKLSIMRNTSTNNNISFATKYDLTCNVGPVGVVVDDFDGDGKLDIATANYNYPYSVSIFHNVSTSNSINIDYRKDFSLPSYPGQLKSADIDLDGRPELIVGYFSGNVISVLKNKSSVTNVDFDAYVNYTVGTSANGRRLSVGDLDLDGKYDIAIAQTNAKKVSILKNSSTVGSISLSAAIDYTLNANAMDVAIGDLNFDGKPEMTVATATNTIAVFRNATTVGTINTNSFPRADITLSSGTADVISLANLDGDAAKMDIVVGYASGTKHTVLANTTASLGGVPSFAAGIDYSYGAYSGFYYGGITSGDIDADGHPDIVVNTNSNTLLVYENKIDPIASEPTTPSNNTSVTGTTTNAATVNWTAGNGINRVVVVREFGTSTPYLAPFDGTSYSANAAFGSGSDLGGGNYVVYNGSSNSVNITGLKSNTYYHYAIYEYNGSVGCELNYLTSTFSSGYIYTLNVTPTLNSISNPAAVCQSSGAQTINLSGISSGTVTETQTLTVSAVSSNTTLIPAIAITYTSPATTAILSYTPASSGTAVITVTVDDGAANNNTIVRTFTVTVDATPTTANAGTRLEVCGIQTNLAANAPSVGTGSLSIINTTNGSITLLNPTSPTSAITGFNVNDSVTVRWTISNGACAPSTSNVNVKRKVCPLTADFTTASNKTQCLSGNTFVFNDATSSSGTTIIGWAWNFGAGANPSTASGQGPHVVTYTTTGTKDVQLTVVDNLAAFDQEQKVGFVTILDKPSTPGAITSSNNVVCQGSTGNQYLISALQDAPSYIWTLPSGASINSGSGTNTIFVDYNNSAISGNITVAGVNTCGTGSSSPAFSVTVNPLPSAASSITGSLTVCEAGTGTYSINTSTSATGYEWSLPANATIQSGTNTNSITVDYPAGSISGQVVVTPTNSCGSGTSSMATVTVNPLPLAASAISGSAIIHTCPLDLGITYSVPAITNATSYVWSVPTGATITGTTTGSSITVDYSLASVAGNITVYGLNACGSGASSNLAVSVTTPPPVEICMVTVDSTSTHNIVVWEKPFVHDIDSFRVYRLQGSFYKHIASVPFDSLSLYSDTSAAANPNNQQHFYKISSIDTCGNEWNLSQPHAPAFLQINVGTSGEANLSWLPYVGANFGSYAVGRDSTGNLNIWDSLGVVPFNSLVFTDLDYVAIYTKTNVSYKVKAINNVFCTATKGKAFGSSASNVKKPSSIVINSIEELGNAISMYPNPTEGLVYISSAIAAKLTVRLVNSIGQELKVATLNNNASKSANIDTSSLAKGVYTLEFISEGIKVQKKLIVQ
ncbi:MAG: VCBS repeat-containing protein [Bacteroidetes bacterium]|nr:VCBS repeat-containing protein [Bacteroidota bacterium]